jgi:hypothetical protein
VAFTFATAAGQSPDRKKVNHGNIQEGAKSFQSRSIQDAKTGEYLGYLAGPVATSGIVVVCDDR